MTRNRMLIGLAVLAVALIPCAALFAIPLGKLLEACCGCGLLALGTIFAPGVKDSNLTVTKALPNGAATISTAAIDLDVSTRSQFAGGPRVELLIEAPALAFADLGDAATMKYEVYHDTDSAFGSEVSLYGVVLTQTGAGGVGAAAATKRVALPTDCKRYLRVKATNSAAGDASDKSVIASLVF